MNVNELLIWLSAKGSGSWSRYRAAVDELQICNGADESGDDLLEDALDGGGLRIHHRLRLNLERLGHAEFFRRNFPMGWRIVPPTFAVNDEHASAVGILCGARTAEVIARVEGTVASSRLERTAQSECPDRVRILGDNQDQLKQLAQSTGLFYQSDAAHTLLATSPPIDNLQLRTLTELPFGEDWTVSRFSSSRLGWTMSTADEARVSTLGLFRFDIRYRIHYYLRQSKLTYKVPVQVGKYVVLRRKRRHVVSYDSKNKVLSVPVSCRPPLLIDRALTLCTGLIPAIEEGKLKYGSVPKEIAYNALELLRQKLI